MRFEELDEQHRVHCFVAYGVNFTLLIASHQIGVHLFYLLGHQAELRDALGIKLVLVAEGHWSKREDRFACLVHWFDLVLKPLRGNYRAEVTVGIYNYPHASGNRCPANAGDKCVRLSAFGADADSVSLGRNTLIANIDVVTTGGEI